MYEAMAAQVGTTTDERTMAMSINEKGGKFRGETRANKRVATFECPTCKEVNTSRQSMNFGGKRYCNSSCLPLHAKASAALDAARERQGLGTFEKGN